MYLVIRVINFRLLVVSAVITSITWVTCFVAGVESAEYMDNSSRNFSVFSPFVIPILSMEVLIRHTFTCVEQPLQ